MAENPTDYPAVGLLENGDLPAPDIPSLISADGASGSSFTSLQQTSSDIQIRQQRIHLSRTNIMAAPRPISETVNSIHPHEMQNIHGATGINHLLMHDQREISTEYGYRLETFHNWPLWFLDPAALAEASFCYTGRGDTVRCMVCEGELSNWKPGDDPRQQHLQKFGFSCR